MTPMAWLSLAAQVLVRLRCEPRLPVHASKRARRARLAGARLSGGELFDEWNATGAVLAGRRTVEQVDHWGGDNHDGVPIFVPSHRPPGPSVANYPLVTYVSDGIESAMAQARAAAGDRDVLVHGAYTAQRALEAVGLPPVAVAAVAATRRRGVVPLVGPGAGRG